MENKMYCAENTGQDGRVLAKEWAYYTENREKIVRQYRNKYVVISENRVVAAYDDENEAYYETIKTIPLGSFSIQHAIDPEEVFQISPFLGVYMG